MAYKVLVTASAHNDIQEAINWEDERNVGLGKRLFSELEEKFKDLTSLPTAGSVRYDNIRCISTKIFRYLIHYYINEELQHVIVLRVLHTGRKPNWKRK